MWHSLNTTRISATGEITATIVLPDESDWFSGHFPGEPVLPGVAQLGIVFDAILRIYSKPLKVTKLSRVRFKQRIKPNDRLEITVTPNPKSGSSYSFRILADGALAGSGRMRVDTK